MSVPTWLCLATRHWKIDTGETMQVLDVLVKLQRKKVRSGMVFKKNSLFYLQLRKVRSGMVFSMFCS